VQSASRDVGADLLALPAVVQWKRAGEFNGVVTETLLQYWLDAL